MVHEIYSHEEDDQTQDESETEEPRENEIETKKSGDGNNTEEQKKLGIDIQMIGAREVELGRTRSQTQEMKSPRNESMERAELTRICNNDTKGVFSQDPTQPSGLLRL